MRTRPFADAEIWFVTGSQGLYGEETLAQVAEQSRRVAAALDAAAEIPVRVVWQPVLTDADAIRRTLGSAEQDSACIGVVTWMHTFSPAKMWISGLSGLRKPLLHLHTQADAALPWATIDMDFMNLNQAAHGDREYASVLTRLRAPRTTVAGHVDDPRVRRRVGSWARAAAGAAEVRSLKLARFGDNMRDVAVTEGDKVEAEIAFGVSVNTWSVNELAARVDLVENATVDDLVAEYGDLYDMDADLRPGGSRHESVRYQARIEAALRTFLDDGDFAAFTTNFQDLGGLRQLPGLAVQRLMAAGYGFGAEGDWKTAALLRMLKVTGHGLPGGTSFMEDYTYHLAGDRPKILGAHMLEVCPSIAGQRPRLEVHPLSVGGREDPARLVFTAAPGAGIVVGWADLGDRFRWVANEIDVVDPDEPLPALPVAHAVWEPRPDFTTGVEGWLTAGGPHHTVLSTQISADEITDLAEVFATELVLIDGTTTRRGLADELRWNAAYHRLAARL
ncbi:L-arabinose isomerase [Nocardia nova]|uniref:L-arabinose isomerase n=1 Tax=Nocardia nova TaxID=37330 RepID=A0A2S6AGR7_9NOCA|nr:L-arabinose isomerase [Nocardia nova]PPJ21629.1 L-arabinose isomerase [Nocardia nova]PPJ33959.1 L-arabinose isomerase [Nocardia nova]